MVRNVEHSPVAWLLAGPGAAHERALDTVAKHLREEGFSVSTVEPDADLEKRLQATPPHLLVAFLSWAAGRGADSLRRVTTAGVQTVLLPDPDLDRSQSVFNGYRLQPLSMLAPRGLVEHLAVASRQEWEAQELLRQRHGLVLGRSPAMRTVYSAICKCAPTDATVLLVGESGTGKELVATSLHLLSQRADHGLVAVNCGAISPTLIESALFGHEKGSFTGAHRMHQGYFEQADHGTLFLDEVTEMPLELQVKLLRVLETGTFRRVGGLEDFEVDVRIIAATNRDPFAAVQDGSLREDLYYRLQVFPIQIPPLRECREDIEPLCMHFLREFTGSTDPASLSVETMKVLEQYDWPGNVRELRNVLQRATILAGKGNPVTCEHIQLDLFRDEALACVEEDQDHDHGGTITVPVGCTIADAERRLILATLQECGGDKKKAAEVLGISFKTVYNRLHTYQEQGRLD